MESLQADHTTDVRDEDRLLSVADVAVRLNVSRATVHRLIQVRELGHVRMGQRGVRIPQVALAEYVQDRFVRRLV